MKIVNLMLLYLFFCGVSIASDFRILTVNEPPANYINKLGMPEGYVVDIVKALQKEVGNSSKIEFLPEARALNIMQTTTNTILFSLSKTDYREDIYWWLGKVMSKRWVVYSLKKSDFTINNTTQLKSLPIIGVVRGDVREEWLVNHKFTNLYSVTNHRQNVELLLKGRISAFVYEKQGLSYICQNLGLDLSQFQPIYTLKISPVFIVMSKETPSAIFTAWQSAFQKLKTNGQIEKISMDWQNKLWQELSIDSELRQGILHF